MGKAAAIIKVIKEGGKFAWDHKGEVIAVGAEVVQGVKNMFKKKNKPISADGIVYDDADEATVSSEACQTADETINDQLKDLDNVTKYLAGENEIVKAQLSNFTEKCEVLEAENQQLKDKLGKIETALEKSDNALADMTTQNKALKEKLDQVQNNLINKNIVYISGGAAAVALVVSIVAMFV